MPLLKSIVIDGFDDVREALANFRRREEMGGIFPSIDVIEEEKTVANEDTIEQSMSLQHPISMVDASSLSLRQSQLDEASSSNCQQITINNTSYYKQINKSTASVSYRKSSASRQDVSNSSSGSFTRGHFLK